MNLDQFQKQTQKQRRIPTLRFPGFTHPWEQRKFDEAFIERRDKTEKENEDILLSCAINGMFLNSELFGHFRGTTTIGYLRVKKNDLILSAQNLHLGNANVNLRFEHGIISPAYKVYDLNNCNPEFVQSWVKRDDTKKFFLAATTEGASQCRKNIEWETLGKQTISMPSLDEQKRVGSFFSQLDNLITLHQRKLDILKQYKLGVETRLFSEISTTKKIKDIIETLPKTNHPASEGLKNGNYRFYTNNSTERLYSNKQDYDVEAIISNTGGNANFEYHNGEFAAMADCMCFSTIENTKYIYYILDYLTDKIFFYGFQGNGLKHLNKFWFANLDIPVPDINKQNEIAAILSEIDLLIEKETYILNRLKLLKQGLLQQMFI